MANRLSPIREFILTGIAQGIRKPDLVAAAKKSHPEWSDQEFAAEYAKVEGDIGTDERKNISLSSDRAQAGREAFGSEKRIR
jgi:hypothetical protein